MKKILPLLILSITFILAWCNQTLPKDWNTFEKLESWWGITFTYPQIYTIESDVGTIWIKNKETSEVLYRFDVWACWKLINDTEKSNNKNLFKVINSSFSGEKYIYYHNFPDTSSCIIFDATISNDPIYIATFDQIIKTLKIK